MESTLPTHVIQTDSSSLRLSTHCPWDEKRTRVLIGRSLWRTVHTVQSKFTLVLAKHSKSFSPIELRFGWHGRSEDRNWRDTSEAPEVFWIFKTQVQGKSGSSLRDHNIKLAKAYVTSPCARILGDPLVPNYQSPNSKCFTRCRLGARTPFFLSLICTELVPNSQRTLATR